MSTCPLFPSPPGTWRVGGVLAVSRAFGDKLLKRYVVAEPEIQVRVAADVHWMGGGVRGVLRVVG